MGLEVEMWVEWGGGTLGMRIGGWGGVEVRASWRGGYRVSGFLGLGVVVGVGGG